MNASKVAAPDSTGSSDAAGVDIDPIGRDTAIPAVGRAPWGSHICQFYATKQDLLDTMVPYFHAGLESDEFCFWMTCPPLRESEALEALAAEVPDIERRMAAGQMKVMPYTAWYGEDGKFDREEMLASVVSSIAHAVGLGYVGTRATGDMLWLKDPDWDAFMEYESGLNTVMAGRRTVGICTYSLERFKSAQMIDVMMRHRFALVRHDDWTLIEPSEHKKATAAVEQMNQALTERTAELAAALADLRGFSRWVSHDLRAPLRRIRRFSEQLTDELDGAMTVRAGQMVERIQSGTARMDQLITDILAYSMAQRTELSRERLDMSALARQVCDGLADAADERHVNLRVAHLPPASGDPAMIGQALTNLAGNAIKFSRTVPGASVEIGSTSLAGNTVYYVRDNGVGFDMAYADKLFGAFERLHGDAEYEGTGLGLAIVKEIITRHAGRVWAEGAPGKGATFYFTLPDPATSA